MEKEMDQEKINNVIKEYLIRAHKSYEKYGTIVHLDRLMKCPQCGNINFQIDFSGIIECLWQNCGFKINNAPTSEELNKFFKNMESQKREEKIGELFTEACQKRQVVPFWEEINF